MDEKIELLVESELVEQVVDDVVSLANYDNNSLEYCLLHMWVQQTIQNEMEEAALNVVKQYAFSLAKRKRLLARILDELGEPGATMSRIDEYLKASKDKILIDLERWQECDEADQSETK